MTKRWNSQVVEIVETFAVAEGLEFSDADLVCGSCVLPKLSMRDRHCCA